MLLMDKINDVIIIKKNEKKETKNKQSEMSKDYAKTR